MVPEACSVHSAGGWEANPCSRRCWLPGKAAALAEPSQERGGAPLEEGERGNDTRGPAVSGLGPRTVASSLHKRGLRVKYAEPRDAGRGAAARGSRPGWLGETSDFGGEGT